MTPTSEVSRYREALERIATLAEADVQAYGVTKSLLNRLAGIAREAIEEAQPVPDDRPGLTTRQAEVLAFISQYHAAHGYSPSFREIANHFGFTLNGSTTHLKALRRKGYAEWNPKLSRSIVLVGAVRPAAPGEGGAR